MSADAQTLEGRYECYFTANDAKFGKESVWSYPLLPSVETVTDKLRVVFDDQVVAETTKGFRLVETGYPPIYYIPAEDVDIEFLIPVYGDKICDYLGLLRSWTLDVFGIRSEQAAWSCPNPPEAYQTIKGCYFFCPSRVDECWVGQDRARARWTTNSPAAGSLLGLLAPSRAKRGKGTNRLFRYFVTLSRRVGLGIELRARIISPSTPIYRP